MRGPFWVTKSAGPGAVAPWPPGPLKTATVCRVLENDVNDLPNRFQENILKVEEEKVLSSLYVHSRTILKSALENYH